MNENLVRLEYTGINTGAIPFRGVSGTVYRASATTYKYIDALPEDVAGLVGSGKFRIVQRVEVEPETSGDVTDNVDKSVLAEADEVFDDVDDVENVGEADSPAVDLSTVASVKESLKEGVSLIMLQIAFDEEIGKENPRSTVLGLLNDAIENYSDNSGDI